MKRRKLTATVAAAGLSTLGLLGGSYAAFQAQAAAPAQQISAGTASIAVQNTAGGSWTSTISNLAAGDTAVQYLNLVNTGSLNLATLSLSQSNLNTALAGTNGLSVEFDSCTIAWSSTNTCGGTQTLSVLPTTTLSSFTSAVTLMNGTADFTLAANTTAYLRETIVLNQAAPNTDQGLTEKVTYTFNGTAATTSGTAPAATTQTTSGTSYPNAVLTDSPNLYYQMNDTTGTTAVNGATTGSTDNGTYSSTGVTLGTTPGVLPQYSTTPSATLNGSGGQVTTPISSWTPSAFTAETWVNFTSLNTINNTGVASAPRLIANAQTDGSNNGFELLVNPNGSAVSLYVGTSAGTFSATYTPSSPLVTGTDYYIAGVYTGTAVQVYLDGMLVASKAASGTVLASSYPVAFGYDPAYGSDYVDGMMGQGALYTTGLTGTQISNHWTAGTNELVAPLLTGSYSGGTTSLSWGATNGATSYAVYNNGTQLGTTTATTYTDTPTATTNKYTVKALNSTQVSPASNTVTVYTTYSAQVLSDSPNAYWKLSETSGTTAADSTGGGNTGTYASTGVTLNAAVGPTSEQLPVVAFNGTSGNVAVSTTPITGSTGTFDGWVDIPSTTDSGTFVKVGGGTNGYGLGVGGTTFDNTGNQLIGLYEGAAWIPSGLNIGTGWHYVAMSFNSTSVTFEVDGTVVSVTSPASPLGASGGSTLGSDASTRYFNGKEGEIAVYPTNLSSATLQAHYGAR